MAEIQNQSNVIVANLDPQAKKRKQYTYSLPEALGRLIHSNYKITINTNKRFKLNDQLIPFVKKFYAALKQVFDGDNVLKYIKINNPN